MKVKRSDRERAKYAFECVKKVKESSYKKGYTSYIKNFPTMILQNGLGNTVAFYFSKGCEVKKENGQEIKKIKDAHGIILLQFFKWYFSLNENKDIEELAAETIPTDSDQKNAYDFIKDKIDEMLNSNTFAYRKMEKEALALSNWLRRFAEGMLSDEGGGNGVEER